MPNGIATIDRVASKHNKRGRPPGSSRKPTYQISVRFSNVMGEALERYVDATSPRTTKTAVIELALQKYLEDVGYLPRRKSD